MIIKPACGHLKLLPRQCGGCSGPQLEATPDLIRGGLGKAEALLRSQRPASDRQLLPQLDHPVRR